MLGTTLGGGTHDFLRVDDIPSYPTVHHTPTPVGMFQIAREASQRPDSYVEAVSLQPDFLDQISVLFHHFILRCVYILSIILPLLYMV